MRRLTPGVDTDRFFPGCGGEQVRKGLGLEGLPVVACVSRLIPRKGQDTLIRAWPRVLAAVPSAILLLVGGGPDRERLEGLAADVGVPGRSTSPGHAVGGIPPYVDAADVFAMPCRTRRFGLEPEALGIVTLEASATGKPVVVGDSGGTADTVRHGETGYLVDPYNPVAHRSTHRRAPHRPRPGRSHGSRRPSLGTPQRGPGPTPAPSCASSWMSDDKSWTARARVRVLWPTCSSMFRLIAAVRAFSSPAAAA